MPILAFSNSDNLPDGEKVVLDKISVNDVDKTYLIENKYKKSAFFSFDWGNNTRGYAVSEESMVGGGPVFMKMFCVFYEDGETWAEVNERYKKEAGLALFDDVENTGGFAVFNSGSSRFSDARFIKKADFDEVDPVRVKQADKVDADGYVMSLAG